MDEFQYFGLPPNPWEYAYGIVPVDDDRPRSTSTPTATTNYEEPWYVDTINRAIERSAQVATLEVAGYPPYPQFPTPSPQSYPTSQGQVQTQSQAGQKDTVTFSNTTLMLLVGGFLLFTLGKRGR